MKGGLVHLKDDLLETNEWKILFKANGKECNILFFSRIFLRVFKYIPMGERKRAHYILHGRFYTQLISQRTINQFHGGVVFSNTETHDSAGSILIARPTDVASLNLLKTSTPSNATPVGSQRALPYYRFLRGLRQIKQYPISS